MFTSLRSKKNSSITAHQKRGKFLYVNLLYVQDPCNDNAGYFVLWDHKLQQQRAECISDRFVYLKKKKIINIFSNIIF